MMSSGKSTLGKKLSRSLGYKFVDLDKLIERDQGSDIPSIFSQKGESYFREVESRILKEIIPNSSIVLAAGGGTPCFFDNMEFMNRSGITIYVEMTPVALAKRLEYGKHKRPLLANMDEQQVVTFIKEKLEERNPFYKRSFLTVNGINITPEQVRNELFQVF